MQQQQAEKLFFEAQKQHRSGNVGQARKLYERILQGNATHGPARLYLAIILFQEGKVRDALANAHRAMEDTPNPDVQMLSNFGVLMKSTGSYEKAAQAYRMALDLDPGSQGTKSNLATLYMILGNLDEAEQMFIDLARKLEEAAPWINLARIALTRQDWDKCESYLASAEDIDAKHPDIHLIRASLYIQLKDEEKACPSIIKTLNYNLGNPEAWQLLQGIAQEHLNYGTVESLLAALVKVKVQSSSVLASAVDIARKNLLWTHLAALETLLADALEKPLDRVPSSAATFTLLGANVSQRGHLHSASATWERITRGVERTVATAEPLDGPLRVGILSSDLRGHAVGYLIVGLLEQLPKGRIEWFAYNNSFHDDQNTRERIRDGFDRFVNVSKLSDGELAERIRKDGIGVLIDLNGMTAETRVRVMAYRPAPVQMTWLGMPGSMGAGADIDYVIGDAWVTHGGDGDAAGNACGNATGNATGFSECLVQLPRSYQPNDHLPPDLSLAGSRADHNLPEEAVVFCSFNQHYKMSPDTIALWGRILNAVPGSVLWILDPKTDALRDRWKQIMEQQGVDASRLVFAPRKNQNEHIARISHADLVLDTWPYNAHTTCSDALRAGTPVVTLPGETFASRVAASILQTAGLQEWIASTPEEYVQKALTWAEQSREALIRAKKEIFAHYWASPMMDNTAFGKQLEALCLATYQRAVEGLAPTSLQLLPDLTCRPLPFGRQADSTHAHSRHISDAEVEEVTTKDAAYALKHGGKTARIHNLQVLQTTVLRMTQPPLLVDVGAGDFSWDAQPFDPLAHNGLVRILGFEPDKESFVKLQANAKSHHIYEDKAIGDGTDGQLHICNVRSMNSLLPPNHAILDLVGYGKIAIVENTIPVQTWRLDDIEVAQGASMIKLDTQGTELSILKNATHLFESVVLFQFKASSLPMYEGQQSLFRTGAFLEEHGYVLHSFSKENKRSLSGGVTCSTNLPKTQLLEVDAVFMPSPLRWARLSKDQLLSLVFLMHALYRAFDVSAAVLHTFDTVYGTELLNAYEQYLELAGMDA